MLCTYKVKNFTSFYDTAEFNLLAPNTKVKNRFPENYTEATTEINLLKTAAIVGENAGGKSNFITSLKFLKSLFSITESVSVIKQYINYNNQTSDNAFECNTLQEYYLEILTEINSIYCYTLKIDYIGIVEERLGIKQKRNSKAKDIFSIHRIIVDEKKVEDGIEFDLRYDLALQEKPEIKSFIEEQANLEKPIGLFVTKLAVIGYKHAKNLVDWINKKLYPESIDHVNYDFYKDMKKEEDDIKIIQDSKFINILRMVDYSIRKIEVDEEKPFSKTKIIRQTNEGKIFSRELFRDSSGVREFFAWAVQIYRVVYENKVVFADEMDRVLNPILSERVISFINGKEHKGQFIFTTHNVLHLDLKTYMKEQIYFITKNRDTLNSELYSLADFPQIRYETSKIYEFYMKGILGGTAFE